VKDIFKELDDVNPAIKDFSFLHLVQWITYYYRNKSTALLVKIRKILGKNNLVGNQDKMDTLGSK
jgi:hypothetical protein